ncbi:MAG: AAA family ATPase [Rhodobacteraceae bacterium]|nr:AAA family ATPase [Paracoccaceae bacterium]
MSSVAALQPEAAPIRACTVSRDVGNFDLLIEDMEAELGESWGDLNFTDAAVFLGQPEAESLEFVAIAVDSHDENDLNRISAIISAAKERAIKVILIADEVSPIALHTLLKMGADGFVPYPLPENALHDAIERLAQIPAAAEPMAPGVHTPTFKSKGDRDGVILPVHGLSGGAGATTFAVNLAWELANVQKENAPRVCLLDFNFQFGSVSTYLDLPRREAVYEMLSDTASLDADAFIQSMLTFNDKLSVLTAPADMLPLDIVTSEDINRLLDLARANFDFIVIDMPGAIVQWSEAVLQQAHIYFSMLQLDMRSAQNALRMLRALKAEDLPFEKMRFVLNRAPKFTDLSGKSRAKRLAESLDITLEAQLPDGAYQVTESNDHGLPLAETAAKNPLRKEIAKLAKQLFDISKVAETAKA